MGLEKVQQDQIDFEFIDDLGQRYRIKTWGEDPWLFKWSRAYGNWVSYRRLSPNEVELYAAKAEER